MARPQAWENMQFFAVDRCVNTIANAEWVVAFHCALASSTWVKIACLAPLTTLFLYSKINFQYKIGNNVSMPAMPAKWKCCAVWSKLINSLSAVFVLSQHAVSQTHIGRYKYCCCAPLLPHHYPLPSLKYIFWKLRRLPNISDNLMDVKRNYN